MKQIFGFTILIVALTNIGCPGPSNNNPVPNTLVSAPNNQCLSSIPTGINGQVNGTFVYPYSCANNYAYYGSYFIPYTAWSVGFTNGFSCPYGTIPTFSNFLGLACVYSNILPTNFLTYSYLNGSWYNVGYLNYFTFRYNWPNNYVAVSCVSSYPGCNCLPIGNGSGICTR